MSYGCPPGQYRISIALHHDGVRGLSVAVFEMVTVALSLSILLNLNAITHQSPDISETAAAKPQSTRILTVKSTQSLSE